MDAQERQIEYLANALTKVEDLMIDPREFGQMQGQVQALRSDMDRMMSDIADIKRSLASIGSQLSEAKGGWKVLLLVGGAAASLGGFVSWLLTHKVGP